MKRKLYDILALLTSIGKTVDLSVLKQTVLLKQKNKKKQFM